MATHSSILACKIPWTEEPGGLKFHGVTKEWDMSEHAHTHTHTHTPFVERKEHLRASREYQGTDGKPRPQEGQGLPGGQVRKDRITVEPQATCLPRGHRAQRAKPAAISSPVALP